MSKRYSTEDALNEILNTASSRDLGKSEYDKLMKYKSRFKKGELGRKAIDNLLLNNGFEKVMYYIKKGEVDTEIPKPPKANNNTHRASFDYPRTFTPPADGRYSRDDAMQSIFVKLYSKQTRLREKDKIRNYRLRYHRSKLGEVAIGNFLIEWGFQKHKEGEIIYYTAGERPEWATY